MLLSSPQRLRVELVGAIRDTAQGVTVTAVGKDLARQKPPQAKRAQRTQHAPVAKDSRGRRLPPPQVNLLKAKFGQGRRTNRASGGKLSKIGNFLIRPGQGPEK